MSLRVVEGGGGAFFGVSARFCGCSCAKLGPGTQVTLAPCGPVEFLFVGIFPSVVLGVRKNPYHCSFWGAELLGNPVLAGGYSVSLCPFSVLCSSVSFCLSIFQCFFFMSVCSCVNISFNCSLFFLCPCHGL